MSMYRGFMAATQAANTINTRRAALAAQALLAHQETAQARQAYVEGLRQTLFEAASVVQDAGTALATAPAAAYYLTRRVAPVLDTGGLDAADFPDLSDKAFHRQATQAYRQTLTTASRALDSDTRTVAERLVFIDTVSPELLRYAAWRDVVGLIAQGYRPDATQSPVVLFGLPLLVLWFGSYAIHGFLTFLPDTLAWAISVGAVGYVLIKFWFMRRMRLEGGAENLLQAVGEQVPLGMTADVWRERVAHLRSRLERSGVSATLLATGDVRAEVARLTEERTSLWARVMGALDPGDDVGSGHAALPA
jgi:hypothetical protein